MKETILKRFGEVFGDTEGAKAFFAPGRVNMIGEHTDYNGGHPISYYLTIKRIKILICYNTHEFRK